MGAARTWRGVFPAVPTKFASDDALDAQESERCFTLRMEAGVDGFIVCGSLGKAMTLEPDEKL
ncbi:dihydrodipicolinate synthase family protein [Stappia stellulata]|uniref:dihydrodipicolinate synthase family protein n=1 Tax=Stappia TaxID=152161 RepID=UPI003990D013